MQWALRLVYSFYDIGAKTSVQLYDIGAKTGVQLYAVGAKTVIEKINTVLTSSAGLPR